jgi:hypothetical protein
MNQGTMTQEGQMYMASRVESFRQWEGELLRLESGGDQFRLWDC